MPYLTRPVQAMRQLQLTCLGNFHALLDGKPLTAFQTDKVRALLVYLLVEPKPHPRGALAQFLWPGYSEESANNSLRQTLHRLRHLLNDNEADPPWLLITRQTVQINPAASIHLDVSDFTRLIADCVAHHHNQLATCQPCLDRLQQAIELYRHDFLADFSVADSEPFEEWRRITQEQLHIQRLDVLTWLATAAEAAGNDEEALQITQRQLAIEPWLEAAHRCVMRILARRGQRTAAIAQYQRCCQVLAKELGTTPEQETLSLYKQIQKGLFNKELKPSPLDRPADEETATSAPAINSLPEQPISLPNNLPLLLSPLIGRERELKEICAHLQQQDTRLLSVVGAGGMGKTHLALAVATQLLNSSIQAEQGSPPPSSHPPYPDGIFFVPLAPLTTTSAIVSTIANCLGLETYGAPDQVLQHFLQKRQLLLILDNFEHMAEGSGLIAKLLQDAPGLQILVTSREPLNIRGEKLAPLAGLEYWQTSTQLPAAVQLFIHYAQQSHPGFTFSEADRTTLTQICQLLQGMPLALEMAAAWTRMLPLAEIAQEIAQNADFLSADWADMPARQRSMRAVFAWSWQLLTESERRILRKLSLFTAHFTRSAAEQIAGASIRTLTSLLNKSLLHYAHTSDGTESTAESETITLPQHRYELHVLVRQFANEQLIAAKEQATVEARYSAFYLNWLAARETPLLGSAVCETVTEIQLELDHIRQAWQWAINHQMWDEIERSTYCLSEFFAIVGHSAEAEQLFRTAATQCERHLSEGAGKESNASQRQRTQALLLAVLALARYRQAKADTLQIAQQALQFGRATGSLTAQFLGYYAWIVLDIINEHFTDVADCFEQARHILAQARVQGIEGVRVLDFGWRYHLSMIVHAMRQGRTADAQRYGAEGLRIAEELGSLRGQIILRLNLIHLYEEAGAFAQIRQEVETILPVVLSMKWRWGESIAYHELGILSRVTGSFGPALAAYQKALSLAQEIGESNLEAVFTIELAYLYRLVGNPQRAEQLLADRSYEGSRHGSFQEHGMTQLQESFSQWQTGNLVQAQATAMQAYALTVASKNRWEQICTLVQLGHIQSDLSDFTAANSSFLQAQVLCQDVGNPALGMEACAGLAQIALHQGQLDLAQQWVEELLPWLTDSPFTITSPFFTYLTSYQVLAANQDGRAIPILEQGYALLQMIASDLDEETRHGFLEEIPLHRTLVATVRPYQAQPGAMTTKNTHELGLTQEGVQRSSLTPLLRPLHHNLPATFSLLIGRKQEIDTVMALLRTSPVVTLAGVGGVGKSALARQVASDLIDHYADGVWWVELASVTDPALLVTTVANVLGLQDSSNERLYETLVSYLQSKETLLLLDDCEHLLAATRQLCSKLLTTCPRVQILATSREPLQLHQEQVQRVAPLATPKTLLSTAELLDYAAIELLVTRLHRADPAFSLTEQNAPSILAICQRLDGLPLALEFAAARGHLLSPGEIAARLDRGFRFLRAVPGGQSSPSGARHSSLQAAFEWSYERLSSTEQRLLRQLAVFVGGFRLEAAEVLAGDEALDQIDALVNKSLLVYEHHTEEKRFCLLQTLREYALEKLLTAGEENSARQAHLNYYLRLAEEAASHLTKPTQAEWYKRLAHDQDNLRAALDWALTTNAEEGRLALRLSGTLERFRTLYDPKESPTHDPDTATVAEEGRLVQATSHSTAWSPIYDWGEMPAVEFFTGRAAEMAQLKSWLVPEYPSGTMPGLRPARLVSILGIGGMGKTTLAAAAVQSAAPAYEVVIWRSLLNAPPLEEVLRSWLQILSQQSLTTPPNTLDTQLRLLLEYLRQRRCLLVLDNVETVFSSDETTGRAGVMSVGYEGYDLLLQRVASSEHQSCLVLTSREQPYILTRFGRQGQEPASAGQGRIHSVSLTGLDLQAGHELLRSNGLHASTQEATHLIENYSGNPLALQIVAATISDFFGGDVTAFRQEAGMLFDGVRVVLDQQFARLSPLERDILIWLAIEREAVSVAMLRSNWVTPVTTRDLLEALQALQNRSLLEKSSSGLGLQNVIIEYTTEYLVEQVCQEFVGVGEGVTSSPRLAIASSFLSRFALLKAQAKEYVRQSQMRLIVKPVAERLVATLGKAEVVAHIPRWLDQLRQAEVKNGYAAGNLLNLLVALGEDLAGHNFSLLPVWQADLRGLLFAAPDFTGADLTNSAFTAGIAIGKVTFLASGELLIAGIHQGVLSLWRTVDGQLVDAFRREGSNRGPLIFSPDGRYVAAAAVDYQIHIWSTATGECIQSLPPQNNTIYALALNQEGTLLASAAADQAVRLWDLRSRLCLQQFEGYDHGIDALTFSPDGRILATGGGDGLIHLWDIQATTEQGRLLATLQGHTHAIGALAFSPEGQWLASGGHDGTLRLWDLQQDGVCVQAFQGHNSIVRVLLFQPPSPSAPGTLLASASADQTVRLWTLSGKLCYTLPAHKHEITGLSFSPDGRQLASSGADHCIYLWNVESGQAINSIRAYHAGPNSVSFSRDGKTVASGNADWMVRLWQIAPNVTDVAQPETSQRSQIRCFLRGHQHFIRGIAFSPSGRTLASGAADRTVRLWDYATGQQQHILTEHTGAILGIAFAPLPLDATQLEFLLASASADRTIRLWAVDEDQRRPPYCQRQLLGHEDEVLTIAFDPTGRTLASGSMDGSVRIWDVATGVSRHRLTGHTTAISMVAISPDGSTLATSSFDYTIRLWDLATGECFHIERGCHVGARTVVFSPDGEWLAYGGDDFSIYLWPWRSRGTPYVLQGHTSNILALDFSPTAPLLISCSYDNTLRLWDLETKRCRQVMPDPGPYAGMKIAGVKGISEAQKAALKVLGAVEG